MLARLLAFLSLIGITLASSAAEAGDEFLFVEAVNRAKQLYATAENDMAKGAARAIRASAICKALRGSPLIAGWTGAINILSSNSDGKGVVELVISPGIYVKTWNNSLSDGSDGTLLDPGSAAFKSAVRMKRGDPVTFSGSFIPSDVDCVKESSLTLDGSLTEPEFIFRFDTISPFKQR